MSIDEMNAKLRRLMSKWRNSMGRSRRERGLLGGGRCASFPGAGAGGCAISVSLSPRFSLTRTNRWFDRAGESADSMEWESDSESESESLERGFDGGFPADVPQGYLAVYVGNERRRFIIPTGYLGSAVFRPLLDEAAEEFGFDGNNGGLAIPCDVAAFTQVLRALDSSSSLHKQQQRFPRRLCSGGGGEA